MSTCLSLAATQAWAGPSGAQLTAGQAAISSSALNTTIQQTTAKAIINWQQ
ncbi:MAG TPA: hypothetical protein HPQ04_15010, partial [Rhodospirillaceae bacterium]|nr:hypothetical protein [Rhodospirillaceae bacterium]